MGIRSLLGVRFDRKIESSLPPEELWRLMKEAIENPPGSPIWPVDLEDMEPIELAPRATVTATYKIGPIKVRPLYHITSLERGRSFSYESNSSHPLAGGATVKVQGRPNGTSLLRWYGSYRPRLHPLAPGALLFVRLYFLRAFFTRLEANLCKYEASYASRKHRSNGAARPSTGF